MSKRKILWIAIGVVVVAIIAAAASSSGRESSEEELTAASSPASQPAAPGASSSTLASITTPQPNTEQSTSSTTSSAETSTTELATTTSATPAVEHKSYKGNGDDIVTLEGLAGPALLRIKAEGGEYTHFAVTSLDTHNEPIDLLVNTLGPYEGTVPVALDNRIPVALEVKASVAWTIEQAPVSEAPRLEVPGTIEGKGDSVVALAPGGKKLTISGGKANTHFAVIQYGGLFPDLLVNEIGRYKGTVRANPEGGYLVIKASASWTIAAE